MNDIEKENAGWKQRLLHELIDYFVNFAFLAFFLGLFTWYRRLVLAEYHISYLDYGVSLIKALVLAKVIMLGDFLRLGSKLRDKPLIYPTLYRTALFIVWVGVLDIFERTVEGLFRGQGLTGGVSELVSTGWLELLARCLVIFCAFVPFFAFKELGRILGEGALRELYFRRRAAVESGLLRCRAGRKTERT